MRKKEEFLEGLEMTTLKTEFEIYTKPTVIDVMQQYADEFACAFAEWKDKYEMEYNFRAQHTHNIKELHEIFKQEINGL